MYSINNGYMRLVGRGFGEEQKKTCRPVQVSTTHGSEGVKYIVACSCEKKTETLMVVTHQLELK